MRVIFSLLFLLSSYTFADEIDRIDSIVNEIETLRTNYTNVQEELEVSKYKLKKLEEQNSNYRKKEETYNKKIDSLEEEVKSLEKRVKSRQKIISKENTKYKNLDIEYTKANTFRTNKEAQIFNMINGDVIYNWEEGRSFTSNEKSLQWVKITGYFIDKVWQAANEELWIKLEDTKLRESNR